MGGWGTSVGAVCMWGCMGQCWWGALGQHGNMGVGRKAMPEGLWDRWEVSMEGGTWGGRHAQWAGGTYWAGSRWVNGEGGQAGR